VKTEIYSKIAIITCVNLLIIMLKNIDKRVRLVVGIILIIGSLFGGLVGYDLRSVGQDHNQIWVLSVIALYAGFDMISKGLSE
jgi:uncharacterized membrane protein YfcA